MPNIGQVLKEEIRRLSKKEVGLGVRRLRGETVRLKRAAAELKRRVLALERENRRLLAAEKRQRELAPVVAAKKADRARLTSKGIRGLRKRLRLTQAELAKLLGVTSVSVWMWENKGGALKLRDTTKAAVLSVRGIGAREARERLKEMAGKRRGTKRAKKTGRKRK